MTEQIFLTDLTQSSEKLLNSFAIHVGDASLDKISQVGSALAKKSASKRNSAFAQDQKIVITWGNFKKPERH